MKCEIATINHIISALHQLECVMLSAAYISTGQILGWGSKAIEIRSAETGHLDGVFMHMKDQKLKFLCERNYKVGIIL